MDARRHDEEGDREHGQAEEQRQAVGPPGDDDADQRENSQEDGGADHDRRDRSELDGGIADGSVRHGRHDRVADPCPVAGEAMAIEGGQRPWVVGVDADVGVLAGCLEDLLDEAASNRGSVATDLDHRQAERRAQDHRRQEARESRRQDPDRLVGPALPGAHARASTRSSSGDEFAP